MSNHLWIPQLAAAPTPSEFASYLRQRGWTPHEVQDRWITFSKPSGGEPYMVEVPQLSEALDYPRAARVLLDNLSRIERIEPTRILRDIKAVALDVVRLAIDSAGTRDGRIGVEAGRRVYEAARDMLLAAACSVGDPRPAFPRKKTSAAMDLIRRARLGQTEVGSFVITIECDIPLALQADSIPEAESDLPMERRTCLRLAQAMASAGAATSEASSTAKFEPFRRRIDEGVNANLCDAIAEIVEAADADALRASFSFATRRPLRNLPPRDVTFSRDTTAYLRQAAKLLRDEATYPAFEAEGHIVRLQSPDLPQGGLVVIHTEVDGSGRHVSVQLDSSSYVRAVEAHRHGQLVRCTGDLQRVGRSWMLMNPRDFVDIEER
jgi:hypothetical protein